MSYIFKVQLNCMQSQTCMSMINSLLIVFLVVLFSNQSINQSYF